MAQADIVSRPTKTKSLKETEGVEEMQRVCLKAVSLGSDTLSFKRYADCISQDGRNKSPIPHFFFLCDADTHPTEEWSFVPSPESWQACNDSRIDGMELLTAKT